MSSCLFGVGLTFPLRWLRAISAIGTGIIVIDVLMMLAFVLVVGSIPGWSSCDSVLLAASVPISSTAIIIKVFKDIGKIETNSAVLTIVWLS